MAKNKLFVVKFKFEDDDKDVVILKAFAGHLSASQYVENEVKTYNKDFKEEYGIWEDPWHYIYKDPSQSNLRPPSYEIEEVEVEEDVVLPELPSIEKENLALKDENIELRNRLSQLEARVAGARSFLSMWDGGWNYSKEHILKNAHAAKDILDCCSPVFVMTK